MTSLREAFAPVATSPDFRYSDLFLPPQSLRGTMALMRPGLSREHWHQYPDSYWDDGDWLEEVQGVATDGQNWFFSSGGSKPIDGLGAVGGSPVAVYTFGFHNKSRNDGDWDHRFVVAEVKPFNAAFNRVPKVPVGKPDPDGIDHMGALAYFEGKLYIDHFANGAAQLLQLSASGGVLSFDRWIPLDNPDGRTGLVAVNPANRTFITAGGDTNVRTLYAHDLDGNLLYRTPTEPWKLELSPPIDDNCYVQGGGVSATGHLYVASGRADQGADHQFIYIYSVLTGRRLGEVAVLAQEDNQELEGICIADVKRGGDTLCQVHAILLENMATKDNVFFKSYRAGDPSLV